MKISDVLASKDRGREVVSIAPDAGVRDLLALLAEHNSIEYAYDRAVEFGEAAKRHLRLFAPSPERDALTGLADYVLSRDR